MASQSLFVDALDTVTSPQIFVPGLICLLTVVAAKAYLIHQSGSKDIYEAPVKHVIKVEEVSE